MAWPDHLLTLEEWEQLPEDMGNVELVEGVLCVSPRPIVRHQVIVPRLHAQLDARLPSRWTAATDAEVVLDAGPAPTVRAPDVLVVATTAVDRPRVGPDDLLLVVEVGSTGTRRTDRVMKMHEYAQAGIPHYWIVDRAGDGDGLVLEEFTLGTGEDRVYERRSVRRGAVALRLDGRGPGPTVEVDLDTVARGA